jgi:uncharacterized repeat protein (TIGR03803 family)
MKACIKKSFVLPVLITVLVTLLDRPATAQTFTTLGGFGGFNDLVLSSNTLYTTVEERNNFWAWTGLFAMNTDGTGLTNLYNFNYVFAIPGGSGAVLLLSGNTLYGTTVGGGSFFNAVFRINTDGTGFTNLHSFTQAYPYTNSYGQVFYTNSDGGSPGPLILSSNTLYGTASGGGNWGNGTVFKVNTDGTGFTTLYSFSASSTNSSSSYAAAGFRAGLVLLGKTLHGTTISGGGAGYGTVFAINTDGSGFTTLCSFNGGTNGAYPQTILLSGNSLYGTTSGSSYDFGNSGNGTVFAINTDGTGFRTLHSFTAPVCYYTNPECGFVMCTNSDGANPSRGLILSGHTLYGTAENGGNDSGTVFALNTDGTGFTTLHRFSTADCVDFFGIVNYDGAFPHGLTLSGNTLYGMTSAGGSGVFSLSFTPQLTIIPSGSNIVLSWPTNFAGFDYSGYTLQSITNLNSPLWSTNFPTPIIVNGQNTVTNPISGTQQFFRLSQ